ncbi:MAG: PD40 domain-containing protein [Phycisphaerales bacterium]|nr:MAG: PD40 domain-containing protein [Phycisphaerales bacterium]
MTRRALQTLLAAAVISVGCLPEKRIVWSPDGKQAAVRAADGLYLCNGDGELSARIAEDVGPVAWFHDSRRLLCVEPTEVKTWDELAPYWPIESPDQWKALADQLRSEILAYEGDWNDFEFARENELPTPGMAALILYVRDHRSEGLREKLGEKWDEIRKWTVPMYHVRVYEISDGQARPLSSAFASFEDVVEIRVSPDGRNVALLVGDSVLEAGGRLFVMSADGESTPRMVAEAASMFPDWSPDGRFLVFARAGTSGGKGTGEPQLGAIVRRQVCTKDGALLAEFPGAEELASGLFYAWMRVRCLRDGRILFTAHEVSLPCSTKDTPQDLALFALDPDKRPTVARVTTRQAQPELGEGIGFFEVSPDETKIAVPGDKGAVMVYKLVSGHVETVRTGWEFEGDLPTLPVWRSDDELCFAAPGESPNRAEIVLWSEKGARPLSKQWPASVVEGFLTKENDRQGSGEPQPEASGSPEP